jgi:hypothetical protein
MLCNDHIYDKIKKLLAIYIIILNIMEYIISIILCQLKKSLIIFLLFIIIYHIKL